MTLACRAGCGVVGGERAAEALDVDGPVNSRSAARAIGSTLITPSNFGAAGLDVELADDIGVAGKRGRR